MLIANKQRNLLTTLIVLTVFFAFIQYLFLGIAFYVTGLPTYMNNDFVSHLLFSKALFFPLVHLLLSLLIVYAGYVYLLWYTVIAIAELFSLRETNTHSLCLLLWLNSVIAISFLNLYFVPHSIFTFILQHDLFSDSLSNKQVKCILILSLSIALGSCLLALINMGINFYRKKNFLRHSLMISYLLILGFIILSPSFTERLKESSPATTAKPNIFLISFDAFRPDYLGFFNRQPSLTPHFDSFFKSSVVFTNTYTPAARTSPSWASILTAQYPLHHGVRENNVLPDTLEQTDALPKTLKKLGYETIYATDDKLFNSINAQFGFDQVIGPRNALANMVISNLSDSLLFNLLAPSPLGKLLFPYTYANHATPHTYDPNNFIDLVNDALQKSANKPLFLAVHFDLSGWPQYWFNDKLPYQLSQLKFYENAIAGNDKILQNFLDLLEKNKLLKHAIVVLLSDHGISLGLPGDRVTVEAFYQGNKANMKVLRAKYQSSSNDYSNFKNIQYQNNDFVFSSEKNPFLQKSASFGVDTSYGYGGDVLSLKQYQPLLAFRGYGLDLGKPHRVSDRTLLLDIAPTLLELLDAPRLPQSEGRSLKSYLYDPQFSAKHSRAFFLESCYSMPEMEKANIHPTDVLKNGMFLYRLNLSSGAYSVDPSALNTLLQNRQRAILLGDWLLAYYATSERFHITDTHKRPEATHHIGLASYRLPPYFVLVNLKTRQWTTERNSPLASAAPLAALRQQIYQFYGAEMAVYGSKNLP